MIAQPSHRTLFSALLITTLPVLAIATQPATSQLPPVTVKFRKTNATLGEVATELTKVSGIPISVSPAESGHTCPADFAGIPFWNALEQTARETGMKIVVLERGTKLGMQPLGSCQEVSSVSGPFRIVAKQVIGRALLDLGVTVYEVYLEVHWEPRIAVYRIDSQPKITRIADDRGTALSAETSNASGYPTDALMDMKLRVNGLTRASKQIGVMAGEFRVTAAQKILAFKFENLNGKNPVSKTQDRVTATVKKISKLEKHWEVELDLQYPEGHPAFESFEEQKWLRDNRLQLVSPDGKPNESESEEVSVSGRRIAGTYRFSGNLNPLTKGWSLVYHTPSPLLEVNVPFEMKGIPLP